MHFLKRSSQSQKVGTLPPLSTPPPVTPVKVNKENPAFGIEENVVRIQVGVVDTRVMEFAQADADCLPLGLRNFSVGQQIDQRPRSRQPLSNQFGAIPKCLVPNTGSQRRRDR